MGFYDLVPEDNRWVLGERKLAGADYGYDIWTFSRCEPSGSKLVPAPYAIIGPGRVADFNSAVYGAIVVSNRCADLLRAILDEQTYEFVPAEIEGAEGDWEVLNILDCVDCLDREKSLIRYHDKDHPRKPGGPRSVERMIIDPSRAVGHDLFRLKDWMVAVIASECIKDTFEKERITGVEYWPVC